MAIETFPFDVADFLKDEDEIVGFLNACVDEAPDDAAFLVQALGTAARARGNLSQFARTVGVSREGLYKALSETGNPSFANVLKMITALGLGIVFVPRPAPKKPAKAKAATKAAKAPVKRVAKKKAR